MRRSAVPVPSAACQNRFRCSSTAEPALIRDRDAVSHPTHWSARYRLLLTLSNLVQRRLILGAGICSRLRILCQAGADERFASIGDCTLPART